MPCLVACAKNEFQSVRGLMPVAGVAERVNQGGGVEAGLFEWVGEVGCCETVAYQFGEGSAAGC